MTSEWLKMNAFNVLYIAALAFLLLPYNCISKKRNQERGKRSHTVIPDDIYNALIDITQGERLPPVKDRTKSQKAAVVRYWRSKGEVTAAEENGEKVLYYKGRRMLRKSEVGKVIAKEFDHTKGSGAAKLAASLKENYVGLSRKKVQDILNTDKSHYRRNAKFSNKAKLKPIRAKDVQIRHQIDLMDMGKRGTCKLHGVTYRYVLSVIDVFSRFIWLRPIDKKFSETIAKELQSIYLEHGYPRVIQCDQGPEFKGAVKKLCRRLKIKIICSRPYHPQSQGKVERSHRSLRAKMEYDILKMRKKGVNWANNIQEYQHILNNDPKEVLGYKTIYNVGEKVYVRLPGKDNLKNRKRQVFEAVIVKRNLNVHSYKVNYISSVTRKRVTKWIPVDDITSLTLKEEKRKQRLARLSRKRKLSHKKKYHIVMEKDDYQNVIEDQGFEIVFNPPGDGNCQFGALAHQLSLVGIYRSPETMREEIVRYLETNAVDKDGFPLLEMIPDNEFSSWNDYVEYMARNHTYGDQITLFAAANIFNIDVHIVSTLGIGAQHVFHPSSNSPLGSIYLGHFAENHGEHYVSLAPSLHDTEDRDNLVDSQSLDLGLDSNTARPTETDDCRGDTDKTTRLTEVDSSGNNNGEGPKGIDLNEVNDHNDDINDRSSGTCSNDNENTTAITDVGVDKTTDRLTETGTPSINDDCNTCIALPTGTGFNDGYKPASPT